MIPRGPDGFGQWMDDDRRIGLAHRRLAIIDLSPSGAQPMASADGRVVISFNGEIYNYRDLKTELEQDGARFRSASDTEVLLHLYAREGAGFVERLRGMFAFALWDADKQGLLLARDPFGIKPLYLADDGQSLRVASQVKALLAGGRVDTSPDPAGRAGFLLWGSVPEPFTLYTGVKALPAGSTLWLDRQGRREERRFFDVAQRFTDAKPRPFDPEALRHALKDSVSHHLIADVPVGVFLSSGLDSATLLALASQCHTGPVTAFTLSFNEFKNTARDETPLAEAIAAHYEADHKIGRVTGADFSAERENILNAMDQPSIDGVNTYFVAREAVRAGLKVALSGLGGDELFAGYDTFSQVPQVRALARPFGVIPGLGRGFRLLSAPLLKGRASPKWAGLLELGGEMEGAYLLRRGLFMPWELPEVMDPDMARAGWLALRTPPRPELPAATRAAVSVLEMTGYMRNQLLRDADWAGMAHSLEIRVPLVDPVLFSTVAPMALSERPPSKQDMARAPIHSLPAAVLERPKTGFFVPVAEWMQQGLGTRGERGLRGWARHVLASFHSK